ncbi:hypothetical protein RhiirA4_487875 [Rhizophagus irregularis]|uniref:Uncharacterized protein n=1 Tax=Rhizophagus irregularis TaxID=588596 RepID=A0A2I1HT70_9GLOM|nr:hypothetical protein RhiirA4_487875 [Rhizophagus irregularis]
MTVHIDITQRFINLKLSSFLLCFLLCSYFKLLLGFLELYIPERFLALGNCSSRLCDISPALPPDPINPADIIIPAFALRSDTIFYISGVIHIVESINSLLVCAWVQTLDDLILDSGIFSYPMVSPYPDVAELVFIIYVFNSLPMDSTAVSFVFSFPFDSLYSCWRDSIPPHSVRTQELIKEQNWLDFLQPVPLMDNIFPSSLLTIGLFTGFDELLTQDPVKYWRSLTDIKRFFSLFGLSRFLPMQSSYHSIDWALSFDILQQSLYLRLCQRFSALYADDSLCPICGTFMETLEHLLICSPDSLDADAEIPILLNQQDVTVFLIERFLIKLAAKASSSQRCKQTYDEILAALHDIPAIGFSELWRPRCKIKTQKDVAKGILPCTLRSYKGLSTQSFHFSAPQVTLSLADMPLFPLQASEWSSLGINWLHSSLTQRKNWFHHLSGFLKSRTVLIWNNILVVLRIW